MSQEEKQLLFKDLCGRLPYNINVNITYSKEHGSSYRLRICKEGCLLLNTDILGLYIQDEIYLKPYLRQMSSMTEEEKSKLRDMLYFGYASDDYDNYSHRGIEIKTCLYDDEEKAEYDFEDFELLKDFLLKNHLDYHGLIEKDLALEAPEGMYN